MLHLTAGFTLIFFAATFLRPISAIASPQGKEVSWPLQRLPKLPPKLLPQVKARVIYDAPKGQSFSALAEPDTSELVRRTPLRIPPRPQIDGGLLLAPGWILFGLGITTGALPAMDTFSVNPQRNGPAAVPLFILCSTIVLAGAAGIVTGYIRRYQSMEAIEDWETDYGDEDLHTPY